jgi:hypothetical protein
MAAQVIQENTYFLPLPNGRLIMKNCVYIIILHPEAEGVRQFLLQSGDPKPQSTCIPSFK